MIIRLFGFQLLFNFTWSIFFFYLRSPLLGFANILVLDVLVVYYNIYNSWSWLGGHADGETDLLSVAIREVKEEAGISNVRPVSEEIFSLESLTVDGHVKKGNYVSSHLHLNITYLLEADSEEQVSVKADENSGVMWFSPEDALEKSTEPWFVEHIYSKLIKKMGI